MSSLKSQVSTPTYDRGLIPISDGADQSAAGGAASVAIGPFSANAKAIRFSVSGENARIKFGDNAVTVTTSTGYQFLDGLVDVLQIPAGATHAAVISESATVASVINWVEVA